MIPNSWRDCLLPKRLTPRTMNDYRALALFNTD